MYIKRSVKEYLDDLAAKKAAPGGGSAAALDAAMGAALMSMVANYTIGNPKYKESESTIVEILVKVEKAREELEELIDKDVEAYKKLSASLKELKKGSPELEKAFKEALEPPLRVSTIAGDCMKLCKELAGLGNKNLITDTAIAAIFLEGAFFSAKFNVYINLKYIKDMAYVEKVHKAVSAIESGMPKLKEDILEICEDVISK